MALETLLFKFLYPCGGYFWRIGRGTAAPRPDDPQPSAGIKPLDPETGKTVWDFKLFQGSNNNGVMATAGGVVFAASREGNLIALDAATGKFLWRYQTGEHDGVAYELCG